MIDGRKELHELVNEDEPAWPLVQEWIAEATRPVEVLLPPESPTDSLVSMQVTTRSPLGALLFHTGGLLVDHGWIRVLGGGHPRLGRALPEWNFCCGLEESREPPGWLLVADDVLGGFFALNGGRFSKDGRTIWYFAPDTLAWEDLRVGYTGFLQWCFSGDVGKFYELFRWHGWEDDTRVLGGDKAFHFYPPLFTEAPDLSARSRQAVPISELFSAHVGAV